MEHRWKLLSEPDRHKWLSMQPIVHVYKIYNAPLPKGPNGDVYACKYCGYTVYGNLDHGNELLYSICDQYIIEKVHES